ncbi:hypothetical protein D9619_006534 [Psilocybe cf. subviscida]|uniref:DUF1771 domain-containing protein n=1 Tax=Psilocybe cf. subviscida TaxID=2480587 RepID=A0A8H5B5H8_9AGAR|nr:hypothetical protein D9619_006534 [Psilocybe cf. subviscida]
MTTRSTLIESLEREFCPTLDSSLIAALLCDIHDDATNDDIDALRENLRTLFLEAEESQFSEFSETQMTSQLEETISSWTTPDNGDEGSSSSASSTHSFSTPIGFLQAALPEVSQKHLQLALDKGERSGMEMWDIVASILTEQTIREMEERGLDGLESDGTVVEQSWETVAAKRKPTPGPAKAPKRTRKIALADVRQQHHISNTKHPPPASPSAPTADPWTQIASISEQLAALLPPNLPSTFQSFFHSPKHATSYDALRAALSSLADESDSHTAILFNLLDIIMPEYEDSDEIHQSRIISDAQLAVAVTEGRADDSLDIFNLLRELDSDGNLGIYHQQPVQAWNIEKPASQSRFTQLPSGPPPIPPPPAAKVKQKAAPAPRSSSKPPPNQWQTVPQRKFIDHGPHPLAPHIPAYTRNVNGVKTARAYGVKGGHVPVGSSDFRRRMDETMRKRNEALREASRMWQKGNAKSRGGEVAFYFAERAREFQELARQEALNAAREMVLSKRISTANGDTVDLHGTTVAEAVVIVKEVVNDKSTVISPGTFFTSSSFYDRVHSALFLATFLRLSLPVSLLLNPGSLLSLGI